VLAQWVAEAGRRTGRDRPVVAWVSLDAQDDTPGVFCSYVIAALRGAAGDVGTAALPLLLGPPVAPETALAPLLNDLGGLAGPVLLVLDDYHVIQAREIHDAVGYLLDHLPPDVHLVLATRAYPPLPLARLRARGELVELRGIPAESPRHR
jgi:LuxR family maltose regulon positive regulatory protein